MSVMAIIKSVQDIMRQDSGLDGDAQRISQLVWMLFLKVFDAKEEDWALLREGYNPVIPEGLRWRDWAADDEGRTGEELLDFVNNELFKQLKDLANDGREETFTVKSVFEDSFNYMKSGTLMRQVINKLNGIDFNVQSDRHIFNDIYENILRDLQNAGNAGEFFTPRAVTQFIVDMIDPKLGEKILDPACGTGGFLVCALEHLKKQRKNVNDIEVLQKNIYGIEKKPLPHMLSITNLILHDIDIPRIRHDNSLTKNVRDFTESDRVDIVITNPPFGGVEEDGIEINFPQGFRTKETADLFLVMVMYILKNRGRCGVVLPDGFLFGEGVKTSIKQKLMDEFNLHTIVRLPNGVFAPYTNINTNLLFFEKGQPTREIWFFEHPLPEGYKNYTKTKPVTIEEFEIEKNWWKNREENEYAWKVTIDEIKARNYNLDIKNPIKQEEDIIKSPISLIADFKESYNKVQELISAIEGELLQ
jgi:type I restriction enzyme M protein